VGTQKPPSKNTKYEKTKLKYLSWTSPSPWNTYYCFPSKHTKKGKLAPTSKQVDNSSRHNPRHTKTSKESIPQNGSHITMKKKVIHWFFISLAQAASVHYNNMHLLEIIHNQIICCLSKFSLSLIALCKVCFGDHSSEGQPQTIGQKHFSKIIIQTSFQMWPPHNIFPFSFSKHNEKRRRRRFLLIIFLKTGLVTVWKLVLNK